MKEEFLEKLRGGKLTLARLLEASPFHPLRNLAGVLTKEDFFEEFFVRGEHLEDGSQHLARLLQDPLADHTVLIMEGFSGTGKTTFLQHFMYTQRDNFFSHSVDLDILLPTPFTPDIQLLSDGQADEQVGRPITEALRNFLCQREYRQRYVRGLYVASNLLGDPSLRLSEVFQQDLRACDATFEILSERADELATKLTLHDAFLFLFLSTMLQTVEHPDRKSLFIFDNLDKAGREHLSEPFVHEIQGALSDSALLFQHPDLAIHNIDLVRDARLVFCLRDPNSAVQDAHLRNNLGTQYAGTRMTILPSATFVSEILETRLTIVDEVLGGDRMGGRGGYRKALRSLSQDEFFTNQLVELYNRDAKTLMERMVNFLESDKLISTEALHQLSDDTDQIRQYLLRGQLMFAVASVLRSDNYVQALLTLKPSVDEKDGYCLLKRMILTWLTNCDTFDPRFRHRGSIPEGDGNLFDILNDFFGIYPLVHVIRELCECFLYHQSAWVHPLTIVGNPVTTLDSLDWARTLVSNAEAAVQGEKRPKTLPEYLEEREIRDLRKVKVRINPSGFSYVRYVAPHFETYAVMAEQAGSLLAQFTSTDVSHGKKKGIGAIKEVLKVVDKHFKWNEAFFRTKFVEQAGMDPMSFLGAESKYSFKWTGKAVKSRGRFHMSRVAAVHVDYVDTWRRFVGREGGPDPEFNKTVIGLTRRYFDYLKRIQDPASNSLGRELEAVARQIEAGGFTDCTSRIHT